MSDAAQVSLIVAIACLLGGGITAAYDIARRRLEAVNAKQVDAIIDRLLAVERAQLDAPALAKVRADMIELRDWSSAEFAVMKTAFDRFSTKQAIAETVGFDARGNGSRQFG